jgi:hypothetical protein
VALPLLNSIDLSLRSHAFNFLYVNLPIGIHSIDIFAKLSMNLHPFAGLPTRSQFPLWLCGHLRGREWTLHARVPICSVTVWQET